MQLFIILALLLYGGKGGAQNLIAEVKPMLETFGGEEVKQALKSAEEISQVLTAVRGFTGGGTDIGGGNKQESPFFGHSTGSEDNSGDGGSENAKPDFFPLSPIAGVASREITYSLSQYVS